MVALHPQFIREDGKDKFVVLPHEEFVALCELAEDAQDLRMTEEARAENADRPGVSIETMRAELGLID